MTLDDPALADAETFAIAVPSAAFREVVAGLPANGAPLLSLVKGLDPASGNRLSTVVEGRSVAVLSGPNHAEEISLGLPAAAVIASEDEAVGDRLQEAVHSDTFRVYGSTDVVGVELCAAAKNVIAIGAGAVDGLGLGDNAKAGALTRGLAEMVRLGEVSGARSETFAGLAGMGDLMVTCWSRHSRNRRAGELIGRGATPEEAKAEIAMAVEGITTAPVLRDLAHRLDIELPITEAVCRALDGEHPRDIVARLMGEPRQGNSHRLPQRLDSSRASFRRHRTSVMRRIACAPRERVRRRQQPVVRRRDDRARIDRRVRHGDDRPGQRPVAGGRRAPRAVPRRQRRDRGRAPGHRGGRPRLRDGRGSRARARDRLRGHGPVGRAHVRPADAAGRLGQVPDARRVRATSPACPWRSRTAGGRRPIRRRSSTSSTRRARTAIRSPTPTPYQEATGKLPEDALATVYLDAEAANEAAGAAQSGAVPLDQQALAKCLNAGQSSENQALAFALLAEEGGLRLNGVGTGAIPAGDSDDASLDEFFPGDALAFVDAQGFGDAFQKSLDCIADSTPELSQGLAQIQLVLGTSLEELLANLFGGELGVAVYGPGTLGTEGGLNPVVIVATEVEDEGDALGTITGLFDKAALFTGGELALGDASVDGMEAKSVMYEGEAVAYFGTLDGKLVVSTTEAGLSALAAGDSTLAEDDAYTSAQEASGVPATTPRRSSTWTSRTRSASSAARSPRRKRRPRCSRTWSRSSRCSCWSEGPDGDTATFEAFLQID